MARVKLLAPVIPYRDAWGKEGDADLVIGVIFGVQGLSYDDSVNGVVSRFTVLLVVVAISSNLP